MLLDSMPQHEQLRFDHTLPTYVVMTIGVLGFTGHLLYMLIQLQAWSTASCFPDHLSRAMLVYVVLDLVINIIDRAANALHGEAVR